jgi:hypothetical protein
MAETSRRQIVGGLFVAVGAFFFGFFAFIGAIIGPLAVSALIGNDADASGAWHQVTVSALPCDCLIKFGPAQSLDGSGSESDPYITKNASVPVLIGVAGVGLVTIEDENGNVIFSYNKTTPKYAEIPATLTLPEVGTYYFIAKLNGDPIMSSGKLAEIWIEYESSDTGIDVPNTGYFYFGGYAIGATKSLAAGLLSVLFFGLLWLIVILFARRRQKSAAKTAKTTKNRLRQEFNSRSLKTAKLLKSNTPKSPKNRSTKKTS